MEVVARGEDEFAMELRKDYVNRFPTTMSLKQHYNMSEKGSRSWRSLREFDQRYDPQPWAQCRMGFGPTDQSLLFLRTRACGSGLGRSNG